MGGGVGLLLIRSQTLGNEVYENRNGILLYKSKRQSTNGKQADTYKVATVANSTSTMHKIASTPITIDCFETGDFEKDLEYYCGNTIEMFSDLIIEQLEFLRKKYDETKDIKYWKELIRWLPESWLQKRTWSANYETLYSIILQRGRHKLETEWGKGFIHWCTTLPYAKELLFLGEARESFFDLYK